MRKLTEEERREIRRMARAIDNPSERAHYEAMGWRHLDGRVGSIVFKNCWIMGGSSLAGLPAKPPIARE